MFRCNNCGEIFEEADEIRTSYEAYYGVGTYFPDRTPLFLQVCPKCHSDDIEDFMEEEDEEEEEDEVFE